MSIRSLLDVSTPLLLCCILVASAVHAQDTMPLPGNGPPPVPIPEPRADRPPVALCADIVLTAGPMCAADGTIDAGSYDPDGDPIEIILSPAGPWGPGSTEVTLTVTSATPTSGRFVPSGGVSSGNPGVTVQDDLDLDGDVDSVFHSSMVGGGSVTTMETELGSAAPVTASSFSWGADRTISAASYDFSAGSDVDQAGASFISSGAISAVRDTFSSDAPVTAASVGMSVDVPVSGGSYDVRTDAPIAHGHASMAVVPGASVLTNTLATDGPWSKGGVRLAVLPGANVLHAEWDTFGSVQTMGLDLAVLPGASVLDGSFTTSDAVTGVRFDVASHATAGGPPVSLLDFDGSIETELATRSARCSLHYEGPPTDIVAVDGFFAGAVQAGTLPTAGGGLVTFECSEPVLGLTSDFRIVGDAFDSFMEFGFVSSEPTTGAGWNMGVDQGVTSSSMSFGADRTISAASYDFGADRTISAASYDFGADRTISAASYDFSADRTISAASYDFGADRTISAASYDFGADRTISAASYDFGADRTISAASYDFRSDLPTSGLSRRHNISTAGAGSVAYSQEISLSAPVASAWFHHSLGSPTTEASRSILYGDPVRTGSDTLDFGGDAVSAGTVTTTASAPIRSSSGSYESTDAPATCTGTVSVVDSTPPTLSCDVNEWLLWPPNDRMHDVGLSVAAQDNCDPDPTVSVTVTSNEADDDLVATPDWHRRADGALMLRAQRDPRGEGRLYGISVIATDDAGSASSCASTVEVPHSRGGR